MLPTWFGALVILAGAFAGGFGTVTLQVFFCLFGATAALELPALGGATVSPAAAFLPFLVTRAWLERSAGALSRVSRAGLWLALTVAWGLASAIAIPRLLAGQVDVTTVDRTSAGESLFPLRPVSGNITQTVYAVASVLVFFSMRSLLVRPQRMEAFARAVFLLAGANAAAAVIGMAEFYLGLPQILEPLRTAGYAMMDASEFGGLVRVQGTFSETSAFSAFTLPLFAFTSSLWLSRSFGRAPGILALLSLALLLVSTSGTAYVGLAAYSAVLAAGLARRYFASHVFPRHKPIAVSMVGVVAGFALLTSFTTGPLLRIVEFFDATVMQKMSSDSGSTRGSWNATAWSNFIDTYGLGVGLGSARASSFALVLLSNLGVTGLVLFGAFLRRVLRGPSADDGAVSVVARAARQAAIASLVAACVSTTAFDLGTAFYAFAAAATVRPGDVQPAPSWTFATARA